MRTDGLSKPPGWPDAIRRGLLQRIRAYADGVGLRTRDAQGVADISALPLHVLLVSDGPRRLIGEGRFETRSVQ